MSDDPAVDLIAAYVQDTEWMGHDERAETILDALPALLREDSPAGDALRERLGLRWYINGDDGRGSRANGSRCHDACATGWDRWATSGASTSQTWSATASTGSWTGWRRGTRTGRGSRTGATWGTSRVVVGLPVIRWAATARPAGSRRRARRKDTNPLPGLGV